MKTHFKKLVIPQSIVRSNEASYVAVAAHREIADFMVGLVIIYEVAILQLLFAARQ
jgi:hypothetical protein